ncbi:MAG: carbohydrate ABC transporter permease [Chloroflexi bacterium]|nr:carbohydrate ABC transporter permease [Chloroflexota bacterium]
MSQRTLVFDAPTIRRHRSRSFLTPAPRYLILTIIGLLFAFPFLWMVGTSLKTTQAVFKVPPQILPIPPQWSNYAVAFTQVPFLLYLRNTLIIAVFGTIGALFCASLVGYSLSRVDWWGRRWLLPLVLVSMMLPFQVKMVPTFLIFTWIHWIGTFLPLIVPSFINVPLFIFLMRQFYLTLPFELADAARADGANEWQVFWSIVLPLTRPALASVAIFSFLGHWNDFQGPLIYLTHQNDFTLSIGLQAFQSDHATEWAPLMAAATVFTLPVVILFFALQRYFVQGLAVTGLKG